MQRKKILHAGLLALILLAAFIASWEAYWRSKGFVPTYNDDKALWALKRSDAYQPMDDATVFIGSSRIKFDLDIPTWRDITGEDAVQLAVVGTSPRVLLKDLADDENFRGKLVVDVTEVLFFSQLPIFHKSAVEATEYYRKQTPSEKWSSRINLALESQLAFLEEKRFSLNTLFADLELKNRPGVMAWPAFPKTFEWTTKDRQTYMPDLFLSDSSAVKRQTEIWGMLGQNPVPPIDGAELKAVFDEVKTAVDKIRKRGGKVIFVRTPSNGPFWMGEQMSYPREKYWDALITYVNVPGLHFKDDPATAEMICPEWSHLSPKDAVVYTHHLARLLNENNWFTKSL